MKYRFSFRPEDVKGFVVEAPTMATAVKVFGILHMPEDAQTTDLWVCTYQEDTHAYLPAKQIRVWVQTTVDYILEENPKNSPNEEALARGLEVGTQVSSGPESPILGKIIGYDADGDPMVETSTMHGVVPYPSYYLYRAVP